MSTTRSNARIVSLQRLSKHFLLQLRGLNPNDYNDGSRSDEDPDEDFDDLDDGAIHPASITTLDDIHFSPRKCPDGVLLFESSVAELSELHYTKRKREEDSDDDSPLPIYVDPGSEGLGIGDDEFPSTSFDGNNKVCLQLLF
jgi:hypothetical protein